MPALPVTLTDELQVWGVRACWPSSVGHRASSTWSFISLRGVGTTAPEMYALWVAHLEGLYTTLRPSGWRLDRVVIIDQWPGIAADYVVDYPWPGPPYEGTGDPTPQAMSPIISWRSGLPGRSYRGRTYWGPIRQEFVGEGNRVVPPGLNAAIDFATAMIRRFGPLVPISTPGFAILSRDHDGVPTIPPVFTRPEYALVDLNIRVIRHRYKELPAYTVPLN